MSGQQEQGFILKAEGDQTDLNLGNNGFILHSPTNSGLKNGSLLRKKTKFDKLLKLYKELTEKRQKTEEKKQEGQITKPEDSTQAEDPVDPSQIQYSNLQIALQEARKQTAQEQSRGQAKTQQLLTQISELDENSKLKQQNFLNLTQQVKRLEDLVSKSKDISKAKKDEQANVHSRVVEENERLSSLKSNLTQLTASSSFILNDLENQKSFLANQIKSARDEIAEVQKLIDKKRQSASDGEKNYVDLQKKLTASKQELEQLKKKYQEDDKLIKQTIAKIKKQKQAEEKAAKSIVELTKKVAASTQVAKKLEKEEHDTRQKLNKIREQQKEKESKDDLGKARARNDKLKAELQNSKKVYQDEQDKIGNLVTPKLLQKLKEDVAEGKALYEENKNLPEKLAKLQKSIVSLEEQKEALHWGNDPTIKYIKDLETTKKRQQEDLSRLEQLVRDYSKDQEKVTKTLEQYVIAYPEFEAKRLKAKKPVPITKKESKEQPPKKVVEQVSATKKKKKGKNEEKSPEIETEFIVEKAPAKVEKVQKVEKKQESPVKVEKKQEPPKQDGEKKKKKKKN